jgi:hypothetical protein
MAKAGEGELGMSTMKGSVDHDVLASRMAGGPIDPLVGQFLTSPAY